MEAGAEQGSCGRRQEGVENMRGQHFILNSDQSPMLLFLSATSTVPKPKREKKALHKIHLSTHFLCSLAATAALLCWQRY